MVAKEIEEHQVDGNEVPSWMDIFTIQLQPSHRNILIGVYLEDDDPGMTGTYDAVELMFEGYTPRRLLYAAKKEGDKNKLTSVVVSSVKNGKRHPEVELFDISAVQAVNDNCLVFQGYDVSRNEGTLTIRKTKTMLDSYFSSLLK